MINKENDRPLMKVLEAQDAGRQCQWFSSPFNCIMERFPVITINLVQSFSEGIHSRTTLIQTPGTGSPDGKRGSWSGPACDSFSPSVWDYQISGERSSRRYHGPILLTIRPYDTEDTY